MREHLAPRQLLTQATAAVSLGLLRFGHSPNVGLRSSSRNMPKLNIQPLERYGTHVEVSRKATEPDQIWGDRKPFHGDENAWEQRVDSCFVE